MRRVLALMFLVLVMATAGLAEAAAPKPVPAETLASIVAGAPKCPANIGDMGLKMRLIDYIDFTDPADPHDMLDQGTSRIVNGPAGTYRATAPHHHAFFSYAYKTAGPDKPVFLVIEYPDDAERITSFMTHDSMRATREHTSFSQETGVYTGGAMPLSWKMQYFTLVSWPQDDWSPLITLNWTRKGGAGVASRMWVYAIDEFSEVKVDAPDPENERVMDAFFCLGFLATRDNFGWQSPQAIKHMCQYFKLIGVNRVTMMVYGNQASWGGMCRIPSWDVPDDNGFLDKVLTQMDAEGGVGLVAGIVADGMYGFIKSGGVEVRTMPPEKAREVILKGFDEFLDNYGKYKSLKGIALGSMETIGFFDMLQEKGIADDVVAHIKKRRPDLDVFTYVGNIHLQDPYFGGTRGAPTTWDVIKRWEKSRTMPNWSSMLADLVVGNWTKWNHRPSNLKKIPGLGVYEQTHPDDHRLHDVYPTQDPRQGIYFDVLRSQELSDAADTPYAAIFSTFTEGYIGLHKDVNFYYTKLWTGPDVNAAGGLRLWPFAQTLANRDRQAISAGSWSVKYFGLEPEMRRFAKAFRSLPPVDMATVKTNLDTLVVRWTVYKGKRYVAIVNRCPYEQAIKVDGKAMLVPPYQLITLVDAGSTAPEVTGTPGGPYRTWLRYRVAQWRKLLKEIRAVNPEAAPKRYDDVITLAQTEMMKSRVYSGDVILAHGLLSELALRRDLLLPPEMQAPRVASAPAMTGDLDAWPKAASDAVVEGGESLVAHVYFPTSWTGPEDLSMRVRLAHDGEKLYMGIDVRDQTVTVDTRDSRGKKVRRPDGVDVKVSKDGKYLDWRSQSIDPDLVWQFPAPIEESPLKGRGKDGLTYVVTRSATGYVVEASVPLATLGAKPGGSVGLLIMASDVDNTPNLKPGANWARKQAMMFPYKPNFPFWKDARNCGKLILGE